MLIVTTRELATGDCRANGLKLLMRCKWLPIRGALILLIASNRRSERASSPYSNTKRSSTGAVSADRGLDPLNGDPLELKRPHWIPLDRL